MASAETLFGCPECGKPFKKLGDSQQHQRDKHGPKKKSQNTQKAQNTKKPQDTQKAQAPQKDDQQQLQWCIRCDKSFKSQTLINQHIQTSTLHNVCVLCPDPSLSDFVAKSILQNHLHAAHNACEVCNEVCRSTSQLLEHRIQMHSLCLECDKCLLTPGQLKTHLTTHEIKEVECPGCDMMFRSDADMILHLESKTCKSGADRAWVLRTALRSPQAAQFTNEGLGCDFKCPTCKKKFREMSGLLQHTIDIRNCDEMEEGPLTDFVDYTRELMERLRPGT